MWRGDEGQRDLLSSLIKDGGYEWVNEWETHEILTLRESPLMIDPIYRVGCWDFKICIIFKLDLIKFEFELIYIT